MRLSLFTISFLLSVTALAQPVQDIWIVYQDGSIDSTLTTSNYSAISQLDELAFRTRKALGPTRRQAVATEKIEFIYTSTDTIIQYIFFEGYNTPLLKLYTGEVSLYRNLASGKKSYPYFLHFRNEFFGLNNSNIREVGYGIIRSNCKHFKPWRSMYSDELAIDLAQQLNTCLNGNKEKEQFAAGQELHKWRLGLACSVGQEATSNTTITSSTLLYSRRYAAEMPRLMVFASYGPFKSYRWVLVDAQASLLHYRYEDSFHIPNQPLTRGNEKIQISNFYISSGTKIELGISRKIKLLLGAGLTLAVPLHFYREVAFDDPQTTAPGTPVYQSLSGTQPLSLGHYTLLGIQARVHDHMLLGLKMRSEQLRQKNQYTDPTNVIHTDHFPDTPFLIATQTLRVQLFAAYSW